MERSGGLGEWQHVEAGDGIAGYSEEDNISVFDVYVFVVEYGDTFIVV